MFPIKASMFALWSFVAAASLATTAVADSTLATQPPGLTRRDENAFAANFYHRALHGSIVLGDYLFIDGGEITTARGQDGPQVTSKENYTYSIDLSTSWTNATLPLKTIIKGHDVPIMNTPALWQLSDSTEQFYMYDGGQGLFVDLDSDPPPPNSLWEFTPDEGGSGVWAQVPVPPSSNFSELVRTTDGIYASGGGLGFALGGHVDQWTVDGVSTPYNTSGMVVYNSTSDQWYNVSSTGYSYDLGISQGQGHFVPSFGPEGLLFVFGGVAGNEYASFDFAYVYEPVSQQWRNQRTTGDIPNGVSRTCVVGLQGNNGTYQIFLYGGTASDPASAVAETAYPYVLSLPSFHWQQIPSSAAGFSRGGHTCNVVGNRQMMVIGGYVLDSGGEDVRDPWTNGIGIFDLVDLEWKDGFDPDAPAYETPEVVSEAVQQQGQPDEWTDETIQGWFAQSRATNATSNDGSTKSREDSGSSSTGAIAGGVVGGVVGLAVIAALIFFLRRHRRKARSSTQSQPEEEYRADAKRENSALMSELDGNTRSELDSNGVPPEVDGVPKSELPGGQHKVAELDARHR